MTSPYGAFDPASLYVLHALLEERNVTRAAKRVGLTQSSMSHRLKLLRAELGDPLLVPNGRKLVPTPRALALAQPLSEALAALQKVVLPSQPFDPRTARRTFVLGMPDLLAPLLPVLVGRLTRAAPNISLRVTTLPAQLGDGLAAGEPELALAPMRDAPPSTRSRALGEVKFGLVARRGHPILKGPLTVERWLAYGHVVVRTGNASPNVVSSSLERQGLQRRVGAEVPTFLAGLMLVAGSDLLMNAPMALVDELTVTLGLVTRDAPAPLPKFPAGLMWHERFQHDEGHAWLREQVHALVQQRLQHQWAGVASRRTSRRLRP
jgi:DNA-binding transcriptional LysR family regulator